MVVRPVCPPTAWEGDMVFKIFDGRFATELKKRDEISPWTLDIEQSYHQFILNGDAAKLITELTTNRDILDRDSHTWNSSQGETYLHDYMQAHYETETQAYNTMSDIQGKTIHRLFSCVTMPISTPVQNNPLSKYIDIPGLLLQYIEGLP
ncbi:hypothetical protein N7488_003868 [Penicillium malachiteum]|nr:hypothetical protein N7488_003868 [Penicillium malachiteum]